MSSWIWLPNSAASPAEDDSGARDRVSHRSRMDVCARAVILALLYAVPALLCLRAGFVSDPDVWWHLRTGEWIVEHHAVPHTDLFSACGTGTPWAAYSWLFELVVYGLFHCFGFVGILLYSSAVVFAITLAMHHMVRRLQNDFSLGVLLTLITCWSLGHLYTPRPWLLTILFSVLEMDILLHARRTASMRALGWLPPLFALWANVHVQFVDGLVILFLAFGESLLACWKIEIPSRLRPSRMAAVLLACFLATFVNPYGWHLYGVAHDLVAEKGVFNRIMELQAMPFRDWADYCVLFLGLASAGALARFRRLLPFETALLVFGAIASFRSQRDVWIILLASAAILASKTALPRPAPPVLPRFTMLASAGLAVLILLLASRAMHIDNQQLGKRLEKDLPVRAVEVVKRRHYAGPVYNEYAWGGYLIWSLRMPVSIDGRAALYGDQRISRSDATWKGQLNWASDPDLESARLVIAPVKLPLTQILRLDPRFQLTFEDSLSAVFISRQPR